MIMLDNIILRYITSTDYHDGFIETLNALKPTHISYESYMQIMRNRQKCGIITIVAQYENSVVGTASMIIEEKFYGGAVAHVEDVAVIEKYHGNGIGRLLMSRLECEARQFGCYKIVLDCNDNNIIFYENCGYKRHINQMRLDLVPTSITM